MLKTKKEIDAHVRTALSKIRTETERHLRSLTIAKLYFKINEYSIAEQYLTSYLSVKEDNDQAHKLLGQCYQRLKKPDKALQAFQHSLQLNPKQSDVLAEVCQLLLDDKSLDSNKAKYWCELAESEKVNNEAVFSLRLKLMNKDHTGANNVEELIQKEISARPNDVQLRVRLVRNYIEKNQILDAFKYVHQLEMAQKDEFVTSSEWYNIVWLVLNKYEQMPSTKKDWEFWLLVAICLERQVQISFNYTANSSIASGGATETANLLFTFDQYLFKISQLCDKFCAQKELVQFFLEHYRGQLLLHASALIFKRELLQNKNKWKETTRAVLPLLLLAYQIQPPENNEPWLKHCDEQSKFLVGLWQKEGSFRCAQMGRVIISCINDDPSVHKENAHNINYLLGSQPSSLWQSNDELLAQVRQICSDRQWRHNLFALLFCNSDQRVKEQTSLFAKCSQLSEPLFELPSYADVEHYEDAAQYLRPQSLQHMVYLCLGNDNLAYIKVKYFSGLNFSTPNLAFCGAESLNQLDIDSFLYAATIQAKRTLEVERDTFDSYQSGNSAAAGKPKILPFVNIQNILCTEEQFQWWNAAYMVYKNLSNGDNLSELRANLQYGIEAVRGINGPKLDMIIVFKLGQLFVARSQDIVKPIEKTYLEARAETIYKYGLNMLKMHNKGVLEPFRKYFRYLKSQTSSAERELASAAEDAASYLASRYFKKSEYEDLIEELSGIQLPFATYLQAEAYRKLDEASKTPKKTKRLYLERASECLNQTLALLKSSAHVDSNHPLNSVIHSEIKRLQQASARYLSDSNTNFSPLMGHNNSSTYEDAEADYYAENAILPPTALLNSSRAKREHFPNTNTVISAINQEMGNLITQLTDTVKLELGNITKEMTSLKEKMSNLELAVKKMKISSSPPSRDDASNVLDDLYLIEDTLQQQLYQQQQQSNTTSHINAQQYSNNVGGASNGSNLLPNSPYLAQHQRLQAAAFNNPVFTPTHNFPINFYGHPNQTNPYMMTQQTAPPPPINQRGGPLPLPYLDPNVPVPQPGLNFNIPSAPTPILPPQTQPAPALTVEPNKSSNLYNLLQQITPMPPPPMHTYSTTPLTHTSMTMTVPAAITNPITNPPTTTVQIHKPLNSQPVEKGPPANVVITSSDPLPNPNTIAIQSQLQPPLSVTIPSHHIKPSLISQPLLPVDMVSANNKVVTSTLTTSSNTFATNIATSTFSFKPQIAAAAAQARNNSAGGTFAGSAALNKTAESEGSDFNRSVSEDVEYDPRPDFKPIIPLPAEIEVRTGEENEEVMFCHRAKLFRHVDKEWKERGIGDIKILKNKEGSSRILMRRDQTHKICANHTITPELVLTVPKNETKGFIWAANDFADESLHLEKFLVRFKLPETAKQFLEAFKNAQNESKKKTTVVETIKKGEEKTKVVSSVTSISSTSAPFPLAKSNTSNFVTSTPATKSEKTFGTIGKPVFGQTFSTVSTATTNAATASTTSTSASGTITTSASKSLFSGLNLSTKTASTKAAATTTTAPSPFANFTFGKSTVSSSITTTSATVAPAISATKTSANTASPFASIFSNLTTSSFTNVTTSTAAAFTPSLSETTNANALNKSATSDTEDDYIPTAQFNPVIPLPDLVEVNTGEENELVLFEHRAKLLRFDKEAGEWKERGLGNIKLLQDKDDVNKVRLVMRREQIHKLCCNQRVYKDTAFKYAKNSKCALSWAGQDFSENELVTEMLTVRFKHAETCEQFLEAIQKAQAEMNSDGEEAQSKANDKRTEKGTETGNAKSTKGFGDIFKPKAGSWSCEACYISNDAEKLYCVACDTPKDDTVPKRESNSNILATNTTTKFNFGFAAPAPATTEQILAAATKTFFGEEKSKSNEAETDTSATIGFGDAFKPKAGSWACQGCYLSNTEDALNCKACNAPKDNAGPKKDSNANTAQKFNFGFGSTNEGTVSDKIQPTNGFGDAFKPKAGSWTCQGCYLSNTAEAIYCTACDAPKDDTIPKKQSNANILQLSNPSQKFSFGFDSPFASSENSNKTIGTGFSFSAAALVTTDSAKSFTFTPPAATSSGINSNLSTVSTVSSTTTATIGKSTFNFNLLSKAPESSVMAGIGEKETTPNAFSLDKKEFSFTLKPKSPGKTGKSPMKFGDGDADTTVEDDGEAEYHEEEENNTYFAPVIPLPDKIEVKTGEEDEELLYVQRAKLYRFVDGEWKERGLGNLKILRHKETKKLRVVMRREQILKICLNHVLNDDVDYKRKDDKSWLFVVNDFSENAMELEKFSLRFKNKAVAEEFMETVKKSLAGTAEVIGSQVSTVIPTNTQLQVSSLSIGEEEKKLADKLMLPYEFFTAKTTTCSGCRGCDPDKFEFPDVNNVELFINKDDMHNQLVPMELPALAIRKSATNRTLLKQSTLSPASLSIEQPKGKGNIFSGFEGANSTAFTGTATSTTTTDKPTNTTFSFTTAFNSTTKPAESAKTFGTAGSGGFLFGSASTIGSTNTGGSIFGGAKENKSIFGQTSVSTNLNESNDSTDKTETKSIFGGSGTTTGGSIFQKPVFGSAVPVFGGTSANDANKSIFSGLGNTTQSGGGNSIFGTSTNVTGFGGFGSNNKQTPIFGALPQFGSLVKDTNNTTSSNATFADVVKTSSSNVDFASLAAKANSSEKSPATPVDFANTATASLDFASLAKANANSTSLLQKANEKPSAGGFIGLTDQNAFSNFDKSLSELNTSNRNDNSNKANESQKSTSAGEEGGDHNDENYDPHYDPIISMPDEITVSTGEEEETKLFGERAVLYRYDDTNKEWKERGVGELKILMHPIKQSYRMVMRREQIFKLVLNVGINSQLTLKNMNNSPRSFSFAAFNYAESTEGVLEKLAVRFKKLEMATAFSEHIKEAINICKKHESNST